MARQRRITSSNLNVTGAHEGIRESSVDIQKAADETIIIVTQAFGPKGDDLVGISDTTFDGHPAVSVGVRANGREGVVHLSPVHGDRRKLGLIDIPVGTRCDLFCPVSGHPLPKVGDAEDGSGAGYFALYLTPKMDEGAVVMVSDIWGHYHSRIIDDMELISYWAETHDEMPEGED